MSTNARNRRLEPAYKQHTAVDDKVGVILDVEVTTGQANEGEMIEPQVDEVTAVTGIAIKAVTADAGYSYGKVYGALEQRGINALIPAKAEPIRSRVPLRRFVRCQIRSFEVPDRTHLASGTADQTRSLLLFEGKGLCSMSAQVRLPVQRTRQ